MIPPEPSDSRNTVMEIRAGAGGDEAGLFAAELYRLYVKFAESRGWKVQPLSSSVSDRGGFKEVIFLITGEQVYRQLKYESGVHRVQRVPVTEASGRIHTSTVTVAVLPEAEEVDVQIDPQDLDITVQRASGPGGQGVNTTDSAVRIVHRPSGLTVYCADDRSQQKNKARAMAVLRSRLLRQKEEEEHAKYAAQRRGAREPLQYVTGETDFCGLKLKCDRRALIPRPETERLVELVKERMTTAPQRVLDLGTGSGAIALALAKIYPEAKVTAVDSSQAALALARENAAACGLEGRVECRQSDWFSALGTEKYDLIVANPPYLSDVELGATEPEVREHEPREALSAGADGLVALIWIIREARVRLNDGGMLALETGPAQHEQLGKAIAAAGYARSESVRDLAGRDRYVLAFLLAGGGDGSGAVGPVERIL
jgi:release factor-specific protein-(glutamine-N5) methyltransferase